MQEAHNLHQQRGGDAFHDVVRHFSDPVRCAAPFAGIDPETCADLGRTMDTAWLEDFICFARSLSFTRAAEERNVSQSAFSRRIRALELWAGTALVDRSGYPAKLSPAGNEFLPVAQSIVAHLAEARADLVAHDWGRRGAHFFAAPHSVSIYPLARWLTAAADAIPGLRTQVISDNVHSCSQLLAQNACHFMMCYRHRQVPLALDESRFERVDLGTEQLIPVCAPEPTGKPSYALPGRRGARLPYLAYAPGSFFGSVIARLLKTQRASLDVRHIDAFSEALKSLALRGAGVVWLPRSAAADALASGALVVAGPARFAIDLQLVLYADRARLGRSGNALFDFFVARAAEAARAPPLPHP